MITRNVKKKELEENSISKMRRGEISWDTALGNKCKTGKFGKPREKYKKLHNLQMALLHHHFVQLQIYSQRIFASCNESAGKYTVAKKYNCPSQNSNGLALQPTSTFSSLSPISHAGRLHKVPSWPFLSGMHLAASHTDRQTTVRKSQHVSLFDKVSHDLCTNEDMHQRNNIVE